MLLWWTLSFFISVLAQVKADDEIHMGELEQSFSKCRSPSCPGQCLSPLKTRLNLISSQAPVVGDLTEADR